jgi:hypothetical protein
MSELDRVKEQLVYLRFWLGIMVAIGANATLWFMGVFGAVALAVGICLVHRQVERRIEQIGKL